MNLRVYELFAAPLRVEDKDRYCVEASSIEGLFGIPEGHLPRRVSELQRYMDGMYASGEISVTDAARTLSRALVYPQVPRVSEPAMRFMRLTTIGLLPPTIRADYGFPWSARHEAMLRRSGIGPHVFALDAAHSPLLASGAHRGSCGEWVRLSRSACVRVAVPDALVGLATGRRRKRPRRFGHLSWPRLRGPWVIAEVHFVLLFAYRPSRSRHWPEHCRVPTNCKGRCTWRNASASP
jgi:ER-bound oxygenase mpaB/B'/Rubber oxygenase, catalytic domain